MSTLTPEAIATMSPEQLSALQTAFAANVAQAAQTETAPVRSSGGSNEIFDATIKRVIIRGKKLGENGEVVRAHGYVGIGGLLETDAPDRELRWKSLSLSTKVIDPNSGSQYAGRTVKDKTVDTLKALGFDSADKDALIGKSMRVALDDEGNFDSIIVDTVDAETQAELAELGL